METPFGVFFTPNLTSDPTYGIGRWRLEDLRRALRYGVSPENQHYYPVFPYGSFTGMSDADISDLWAYLRTVQAVPQPNRAHELGFPFNQRLAMAPWKILFLYRGPLEPAPEQSPVWNRGRYLVTSVTHCADCHSPRNILGAIDRSRFMAGVAGRDGGPDGWSAPNLTPDPRSGIGRWTVDGIAAVLAGRGMRGMHIGGPMREVVWNTAQLTEEDRRAIAVYVKSLPAVYNVVRSGGGCCR